MWFFAYFWRALIGVAIGHWFAEEPVIAALTGMIAFWLICWVWPVEEPKRQDPWRKY